ncbi:MAG: hypothetical protein ACLQPD_12980 [Desulfomonilaceae bacterium]
MEKNRLIEEFQALVEQHGHDWTKIAAVLNERKTSTPTGGTWNNGNARSFYRRRVPENDPKGPAKKDKPPKVPSASSPLGFPEWMDSEAMEDLKDLLDWWRQKKSSPLGEIQARPVFKGTRRNSGFHINATILKRAADRVKKDKVRTGGSLSMLVELLLWEYLDRPQDLLER